MLDFRRLTAALAVLCLLFVSSACRKQTGATNPTQPASPYVRLATYNAVPPEPYPASFLMPTMWASCPAGYMQTVKTSIPPQVWCEK